MGMRRRDFIGGVAAAIAGIATRASAGPRSFDLICRKAWGAKAHGSLRRHTIRRLTVHHSGAKFTDNRDAPARIRSIQNYHQSKGWPDIAYHLIIDRHGNVYRGRPTWAVGNTATNYDPRGHLLVLCLGNFNEQSPTRAMKRSLVKVLAWASAEYDVPVRRIRGHRYYASTACPGRTLGELISNGTIRRAVRQKLAEGGVRKHRLCGAAGAARVRAIEDGTD
jgi:N-acetylmuramoyl-L-alanine amidase